MCVRTSLCAHMWLGCVCVCLHGRESGRVCYVCVFPRLLWSLFLPPRPRHRWEHQGSVPGAPRGSCRSERHQRRDVTTLNPRLEKTRIWRAPRARRRRLRPDPAAAASAHSRHGFTPERRWRSGDRGWRQSLAEPLAARAARILVENFLRGPARGQQSGQSAGCGIAGAKPGPT